MLMKITTRRFAVSSYRKDLYKVSSAAVKSNIRWCWKLFSGSISSDHSTPQGRRRVTKQERYAMVVAFVEKYMDSNAGKFPTTSCIHKQIGGSYYVIREITQELEYNRNRASSEITKELVWEKEENAKLEYSCLTKEPYILAAAKQIPFKEYSAHATEVAEGSSQKVEKDIEIDVQRKAISKSQEDSSMGFDNVCASSSASAGAIIKPQTHKYLEMEASGEVEFHASSKLKTRATDLLAPAEERGGGRKNASSTDDLQHAPVTMRNMINNEEVSRSEEINLCKQQLIVQNVSSAKALSFWGNLKAMALGIFNLMKK